MPLPNSQPCSRCGKPWVPWRGSKLKTHARCHFTDEAADDIFDLYTSTPKLTVARCAADLGVTTSVLKATLVKVQRRRNIGGRLI